MKHEVMKTWVKALRSGEYQQAQGTLRIDGKYCCLGVLCDLAEKANVGAWEGNEFRIEEASSWDELPNEIQTWAGVHDAIGCFRLTSRAPIVALAELNDNGSTFAEIADIIEANWEAL